MTAIAPTSISAAPQTPDSSVDEPDFDSAFEAFLNWLKVVLTPGINALAANVYNNALAAAEDATTAQAAAGQAGLHATAAGTAAGAAADSATLSQNWATSLTVVSGGLFGARYYAQQAQAAVTALPAGTINDSITAIDKAWSSTKISAELSAKVNKTGDTLTGALNEASALSLASAATTDIGSQNSNTISVTGATTIASLGTATAGVIRRLIFVDALTLTHNSISLILPGASNITTAAGDTAEFLSLGTGNWRCTMYQPASGKSVISITGGDTVANVGYLNIPQNSRSAAYTLALSDAGKHILHPSADTTARVFTIPANSTVAFPIGTAITFINQVSAGMLTISITTDTMRLAGTGTTGSRTLAANGVATAIKLTATEWIISGTGLT